MFALAEIWFVLSLLVGWAGVVVAVVRDAHGRIENPAAARAAGLLAAALPILGGVLWLCLRPHETRAERRERRLVDAVCELEAAPATPPVAFPPAAPGLRRAA